MRFGLLSTSAHDWRVPMSQQIAEHAAVARMQPCPRHGSTQAVRRRGDPAIVRLESRVYGIGQYALPRSTDWPLLAL